MFLFLDGLLQVQTLKPRMLADAMIKRVDVEHVKKQGELWPGGDLRIRENQWLRASFQSSGLSRVPRETALRLAVEQLVKKKHLRAHLRKHFFPIVDR